MTALPALAAHTQARLLLAADAARAGETVLAAIQLEMDPGWHTYWKNPGGSGMATTVQWNLPPGVSAGDIQWPLSEKAAEDELTTYIYNDSATLLVPLKLDSGLKPGPWMENFKIAMGFPMLATAVWLASILPVHYGARAWWFYIFLVMVGLAAWVFGRFGQRGRSRRGLGALVTVAIPGAGYGMVLEEAMEWRSPLTQAEASSPAEVKEGFVVWKPWSAQAVADARAQGRPVLVDFTAKWCVTCNMIVKPALENQTIRDALAKLNAVALLGDYTKTPENITVELNRFGRAGVPLGLVYPKDPAVPAIVLPEPSPLRPPSHYTSIVLEALERAGR